MPIYALGEHIPQIHATAYVHPNAVVIGQVTVGEKATIWPTAVLRGDYGAIVIGAGTSIQDGTVVHATAELATIIGDRCVVGHNAHLEGCLVHDDSLIGSGSVVLQRAEVGPGSLVGAGAVVSPGTLVPPNATALGVPATIRPNTVLPGAFRSSVERYIALGARYRSELRRLD